MKNNYPTALEACFDYAGREMVERWQDEENPNNAERIAREYLLELVTEGEVLRVQFEFDTTEPHALTVTVEE